MISILRGIIILLHDGRGVLDADMYRDGVGVHREVFIGIPDACN